MVDITFPAYGSLYFADAPLESASKKTLSQGFCIGPHCRAMYWDCNVGESRYSKPSIMRYPYNAIIAIIRSFTQNRNFPYIN